MSELSRKFLVTGATGKTGAYVVRQLLERGERVRALVHREDERSANLAAAGAEIVVADILDLAAVTARRATSPPPTSPTRSCRGCLRPPRSSPRLRPSPASARW